MRLKIDMTLTAATAQRFRETAERLANMNLGDDGLLAAAVLERIATSYDAAVIKTKIRRKQGFDSPWARHLWNKRENHGRGDIRLADAHPANNRRR
jgi:hypothetical protein